MTSEHTYTGLCGKRELKRLARLRPSPLGGRQSGAGIRHVRGPFDPGRGSASACPTQRRVWTATATGVPTARRASPKRRARPRGSTVPRRPYGALG